MRIRALLRLSVFISLLCWWCVVAARGEELVLHIPKMAKAPVIDGVFREAESADASATAGFRGAIRSPPIPSRWAQCGTWGTTIKTSTWPCTRSSLSSITLKADANSATRTMKTSSSLMTTWRYPPPPMAASAPCATGSAITKSASTRAAYFSDTWYYNGVPGSERLWSSGADIKCTTTKTSWTMTMAWPLRSMKIDRADHTELIMHLSRAGFCSGWYFASCAPGIYLSWNEFYKMILDPDAPAVQFLRHGDI